MMQFSSNKIYFLVYYRGRVESYGVCRTEKAFRRKKSLLEDMGCSVRRVDFRTWKRFKEEIDKKDEEIKMKYFKMLRREGTCA